jgi:hypothetical protein
MEMAISSFLCSQEVLRLAISFYKEGSAKEALPVKEVVVER